jgi:hypothetical protein
MRLTIIAALVALAAPAFAAAPETSPRPVQGPEFREVLGCTVWRPGERGYWVRTDPTCAFGNTVDGGNGGSAAPGLSPRSVNDAVNDALDRVRT